MNYLPCCSGVCYGELSSPGSYMAQLKTCTDMSGRLATPFQDANVWKEILDAIPGAAAEYWTGNVRGRK